MNPPAEQSPDELLPPGAVVGDYLVEHLLGTGGFANVYRATHLHLNTQVAIKVLSRALALDTEAMRRFVREAQSAIRIAHPNVVRVLGFGMLDDGRAYQVMELVGGPTLEEHLAEHDRLDVAEALELLSGIAAALDAAHRAGIVHRDLKPANVLLAPVAGRLVPRLADFGIAKALEAEQDARVTRTGMTLGTPLYMSPEQALGRSIGAASDVYSFGVVAFELLTGCLPYEGESPFATMMLHVQAETPLPSTVAPGLGVRFDSAIQAMLAKRPEDRPATLLEAMQALRTGSPAAPAGVATDDVPRVPEPRPRRRAWPAIVAIVTLVGAAVVAAVALREERTESRTSAPPSTGRPAPVAPPREVDLPLRDDTRITTTPEVERSEGTGKGSVAKPSARAKSARKPPATRSDSSDSFEMPPDYTP